MTRARGRLRAALLLAAAGLAAPPARAHSASDAFLSLAVADGGLALRGRLDVALRDLELAVGLDADADGRITWGELRAQEQAVAAYALAHLRVTAGSAPCAARVARQAVDRHAGGAYAALELEIACPRGAPLALEYDLLFALDPQHRGLLRVARGAESASAVLSPARPRFVLRGGGARSAWRTLADFTREGVWHIWIGADHGLFVLCLLLPAALRREAGRWVPVASGREAAAETLRVVSAFTLAHSATLAAAALGWLALPSRLVESAIAASLVATALDNVRPFLRAPRAALAFGFGLVHGLGFASVLGELGLPGGARALALLGFNAGVELGQLAIVAVGLPLALAARRWAPYPRVALAGGSAAIGALASVWLWERAAGA